ADIFGDINAIARFCEILDLKSKPIGIDILI
ncbi:MAG: hypothetical protein AWU58_1304, partial [Methanohalophilus sp. T328-1]